MRFLKTLIFITFIYLNSVKINVLIKIYKKVINEEIFFKVNKKINYKLIKKWLTFLLKFYSFKKKSHVKIVIYLFFKKAIYVKAIFILTLTFNVT